MLRLFFIGVLSALLVSCGADVGTIAPAVGGQQLKLKFADGYRTLALSEISSITVKLANTSKTITDVKLSAVTKSLALHAPWEPGTLSGELTGIVTIDFVSADIPDRKLLILNATDLQDSTYTSTYYRAYSTINEGWLNAH